MSNIEEVFELIGERYLDVTHSKESIASTEGSLKNYQIHWTFRWILEIFAAGGLWWNIFLWEWFSLDLFDMISGWILNFIICTGIFLFMWLLVSIKLAVICACLFLISGISMGLLLRQGSKEKN